MLKHDNEENIFASAIRKFLGYHASLEPILKTGTVAWAFAAISAFYVILVTFYCNDREIPFFEFAATTGAYIWIVGALVIFFYAALSAYSLAPVFMKVAVLERVQISNATAIGLTLAPAVTAVSIIFMGTLFLKEREFVVAAATIVMISLVTCIICFYRYLTAPLIEGATNRAGDAVLGANAFVIPVFILVSKLSLMGIRHLESTEFLQESDLAGYAWSLYIAVFLLFPVLVVILFNTAPGFRTRKNIFFFGALVVVAPLMLAPFATFDRVLAFLSVGGDMPFTFALRKGDEVWGRQEVRGYVRFIGSDNAHISCGRGTHVATLNLRHVAGFRRILEGEDVNCSSPYPVHIGADTKAPQN